MGEWGNGTRDLHVVLHAGSINNGPRRAAPQQSKCEAHLTMDLSALLPQETDSEAGTVALGAKLAAHLEAGDVVALSGDLGSGKTQLVKGIAEGLELDPAVVTSPTFTLVHEYGGEPPLVHIDLYRLDDPDDLIRIDLDDRLMDESVLAIEWPEVAADLLPDDTVYLRFTHLGGDRRRIEQVDNLSVG